MRARPRGLSGFARTPIRRRSLALDRRDPKGQEGGSWHRGLDAREGIRSPSSYAMRGGRTAGSRHLQHGRTSILPLLETTSGLRKVWETACLAGSERTGGPPATCARGKGSISWTGATAGMRGGVRLRRLCSAKSACGALAPFRGAGAGTKGLPWAMVMDSASTPSGRAADRRAAGRAAPPQMTVS